MQDPRQINASGMTTKEIDARIGEILMAQMNSLPFDQVELKYLQEEEAKRK